MKYRFFILMFFCFGLLVSCNKEPGFNDWVINYFTGSYKNYEYSENLIKEFTPVKPSLEQAFIQLTKESRAK